MEGEAPATTGCYKQYEHAITNKIPQSTDPSQVRVPTNGLGASMASGILTVSNRILLSKYRYKYLVLACLE